MFRPTSMSEPFLPTGTGQSHEDIPSTAPSGPASGQNSQILDFHTLGNGQQTMVMSAGHPSSQDAQFAHQTHQQISYASHFPVHPQMAAAPGMLPPLSPTGPSSAPASYGPPLMSANNIRQRTDYHQFQRRRSISPRGVDTTGHNTPQSGQSQHHDSNQQQQQQQQQHHQTFVDFGPTMNTAGQSGQMQTVGHPRFQSRPQLQSPVHIGNPVSHTNSGRQDSMWATEEDIQAQGLSQPPNFLARTPRHQVSGDEPVPKARRLSTFEFSAADQMNSVTQTTPTSAVYSSYPPRAYFVAGRLSPRHRGQRSKRPFTSEEDAKLISLKESGTLTWRQIAEQFDERSSGTLQVRYCTKLKEKTRRWSNQMETKLIALLREYHNNRWRVMASRMGSGFSASNCRLKALELAQDGRLGEDPSVLGASSFDISENEGEEATSESISVPSNPPTSAPSASVSISDKLDANTSILSSQSTPVTTTPTEVTNKHHRRESSRFAGQKRTQEQLNEDEEVRDEGVRQNPSRSHSLQQSSLPVLNLNLQSHDAVAMGMPPASLPGVASSSLMSGSMTASHIPGLHRPPNHSVNSIPLPPAFHTPHQGDGISELTSGPNSVQTSVMSIQHSPQNMQHSPQHIQHSASHPSTPVYSSQQHHYQPQLYQQHTGSLPALQLAQPLHRSERQSFPTFSHRNTVDQMPPNFRNNRYSIDTGQLQVGTDDDSVTGAGGNFSTSNQPTRDDSHAASGD